MENKMNESLEVILKHNAEMKNISWEDAKYFFEIGFYQGKINAIMENMK